LNSRSLFIVRHAIAADREEFKLLGRPDADRPLTDKGRKKLKKTISFLLDLSPIECIASSPLARAKQTADQFHESFKSAFVCTNDALGPNSPPELLMELAVDLFKKYQTVLFIGHEPCLSTFVGWCLSARKAKICDIKKASLCHIRFNKEILPGEGILNCLIQPSHLKTLKHTDRILP